MLSVDLAKERGPCQVNAYEQLLAIRDRLEQNGASEDSIDMVDKYLARASTERESSTSVPMPMMIKHLLRQRDVLANDAIYNDLQELLDEQRVPRQRDPDEVPFAWEEERRPRPHSYYKQLKSKEKNKE
jgi:hypothetical protein